MEKEQTKHTEGEWEALLSPANDSVPVKKGVTWCIGDGTMGLAIVAAETDQETEANAKLMAAAPDLLKALKTLIEEYDKNDKLLGFDILAAREAIEKAT